MKLLVVGGKLQGTEAVYLAGAAGYDTVLVDRRPHPPAAGLAQRHVIADITADDGRARSLVQSCDAVLPACEDLDTLTWLAERVPVWGVPFLFDLPAYRVTMSKQASRRLFAELGVPRPLPWPEGGFPAVVKPDAASGSEGVQVVGDEAELRAARERLESLGHRVVVEEYVAGPSLSIEVLAWGGRALPLQVTGLEFDAAYDCRRVVAPVGERESVSSAPLGPGGSCRWSAAVAAGALAALDDVAVLLAESLGLRGIMDVEVMVGGAEPKVLEIDARLPSQTPTAVYWSSGLNMLQAFVDAARGDALPRLDRSPRRACVYQHVSVHDGVLEIVGEHVMAGAAPLRSVPGFFGADEALTDYRPGASAWSATLICAAPSAADAGLMSAEAVREIADSENIHALVESECRSRPEAVGA